MADFNPIVPVVPNNPTPQIITQQDTFTFPTSIILNETNYPLWSQLMEMRIDTLNKARYLTGEMKKPAPENPSHATWITKNHRVKSWLIDSMSQSLMQRTTSQEGTVEGVVQSYFAMARLRVHIFLSGFDSEFDQDILTRMILGYDVKRGKLYYLELTENGEQRV
ncbi:hypothetical protein RJ640_017017 [Escallonia rubra]|uniref:Retrotransposon Copia-like N-terminal domain-containing protein n=1 Tax=Escallonia rubra TaxID=112253 RepID=A0AA88RCP9_9ASTE|nr:hypothetical protein RJ640_017017 [Escallonia rubra]